MHLTVAAQASWSSGQEDFSFPETNTALHGIKASTVRKLQPLTILGRACSHHLATLKSSTLGSCLVVFGGLSVQLEWNLQRTSQLGGPLEERAARASGEIWCH